MDDPRQRLNDALKEAMRGQDTLRRDVIRIALSAIKQVEVDERRTLTPDDVFAVLQREAKQRRESIAEAENAGRLETAQLEREKLAILEEFLPRQLSRDEVAALARDAIDQTGATSARDMGKVMGVLMPQVKGRVDGKIVNDVVRE